MCQKGSPPTQLCVHTNLLKRRRCVLSATCLLVKTDSPPILELSVAIADPRRGPIPTAVTLFHAIPLFVPFCRFSSSPAPGPGPCSALQYPPITAPSSAVLRHLPVIRPFQVSGFCVPWNPNSFREVSLEF
ncbi:hypothetical protein SDJN03_27416, partial [Cucurbita argyrosperma subsp. sororia]